MVTNKPHAHRKNKNQRPPRSHLADLVSLFTSCHVARASLFADWKNLVALLRGGGCGVNDGSEKRDDSVGGSKGRFPGLLLVLSDSDLM